ncbi:hypothetical protein AB1Y20_018385 [Prymnesium parvum]|uniref:Uncharacterized protein n=1 Tax=Prymnesium parvum TaxID=97485 RepID=A0AB34JPT2_PRYPA
MVTRARVESWNDELYEHKGLRELQALFLRGGAQPALLDPPPVSTESATPTRLLDLPLPLHSAAQGMLFRDGPADDRNSDYSDSSVVQRLSSMPALPTGLSRVSPAFDSVSTAERQAQQRVRSDTPTRDRRPSMAESSVTVDPSFGTPQTLHWYQLPSNPRVLVPEELGVWMEVRLQKATSFFGNGSLLGEFYVVIDRKEHTLPGATHEAALPSSERNLHRAQPSDAGSLRWYDNDGPHKRQIDAIDLGLITGADVRSKFEEVQMPGQGGTIMQVKLAAPVLARKTAYEQARRAGDGKRAKLLIVDELGARHRPAKSLGASSALASAGGSYLILEQARAKLPLGLRRHLAKLAWG